jgi:Lon protease-like protein
MDQLLALFPLQTVLFPGVMLPLNIFEERYKRMIGRCIALKEPFGVVLIREGFEVGGPAEPHEVGTTAVIKSALRFNDDQMFISAEGQTRFRIQQLIQQEPYLIASVETIDEEADVEHHAQASHLLKLYERYRAAIAHTAGPEQNLADLPRDPVDISFQLSAQLQVPYQSKQQLLEADLETRLEALIAALNDELRFLPQPTGAPPPQTERRWSLN